MKVQFSNFKLYLEGKETKFNSISLNETGFGPSTCVVTIPANANIMNVLPGTIIQLFYYWDPNPPSNGEERTDTQRYKIIFEGELHGKSFTKISGKEMAQLSFRSLFSTLNRTYKKAAASLTMEANHNGLFLALDSSSDEAFTFESPEYQQATDSWDNDLVGIKEFFVKIQKGLSEEDDNLLKEAITKVIEDAENLNEWFKYFSNAYNLKDRLLIFNNKHALTSIFAQIDDIFNRTNISQLGNAATFSQIIYKLLSHIGYSMIYSSSPQYGDSRQTSLVFLAASDYLLPIKQNLFFGESANSAGFTQTDINEPTRLALSSSPLNFLMAGAGGLAVRPTFYAPYLITTEESIETGKVDYSVQEQFTGVIPSRVTLQGIEAAYANVTAYQNRNNNIQTTQKEVNDEKDAGDKSEKIIKEPGVTNHIKNIAQRKYWDSKYEIRNFSVTTPYNPNRMAGFPGLFMDENMPTVMGTIKSIATNITAEGSAVSTVTFIKPMIVPDWSSDFISFEFHDQCPKLDKWFDEDVYGFDNIGSKVYNKILGISSEKDLSSIMSFKDSPEYKDLLLASTDAAAVLNDSSHPYNNTAKLSILSTAIKNIYKNLSPDLKENFEKSVITRNLLTEDDYWEFILSPFEKRNEDLPYSPNNCSRDHIYRDVFDDDDKISISNKEYDSYKPFVLQRLEIVETI